MINLALVALFLVAFATAVTCHLALAVGLGRRYSLGRGLIAFLVPPVAIGWGFASRMWARSTACVLGIAVYGAAFLLH